MITFLLKGTGRVALLENKPPMCGLLTAPIIRSLTCNLIIKT